MKKIILMIFLGLVVLWIISTYDCVKNRWQGGMKIDWREVKDCSY